MLAVVANEAHLVIELTKFGGGSAAIGILSGAALGYGFSEKGEEAEYTKNGALAGGVFGALVGAGVIVA